ncbi:MAG: RNA polymerase sigma factor [Myxococcota bacterium]
MRQPKTSDAGGRIGDPARGLPEPGPGDLGRQILGLRPRMTSVALRYAPDRDAAEDIVQNACEKALRHLDQFRGRARLSTWLHRIVVNESLMWLRSEKRRAARTSDLERSHDPQWAEAAPGPGERLDAEQRRQRLLASLAALPPDEREVIQRCGLEELSYEQFSAERGLRPAAVKSRAFRGRRRLRALLARDGAPSLRDF